MAEVAMSEVAEASESPDEDERSSPDEKLVAIQKQLQALNNEVAAVRRQLFKWPGVQSRQ